MQKRRILNLTARGIVISLCIFALTGCKSVENKLQEKFQETQNETINIWENQKAEQKKKTADEIIKAGIAEEIKSKIDKWIEKNGLNMYGDKKDIMYAGGTPLFNEATGEITDRYEYILRNHPELIGELGIK